jgi:hypothetical protein
MFIAWYIEPKAGSPSSNPFVHHILTANFLKNIQSPPIPDSPPAVPNPRRRRRPYGPPSHLRTEGIHLLPRGVPSNPAETCWDSLADPCGHLRRRHLQAVGWGRTPTPQGPLAGPTATSSRRCPRPHSSRA